ncbi:MAG: BamA/TamA family outer membrane protein [Bordetella sp.]|nr:MAG: BamA/TamA family outer membrane protein [Bordetella sp.]
MKPNISFCLYRPYFTKERVGLSTSVSHQITDPSTIHGSSGEFYLNGSVANVYLNFPIYSFDKMHIGVALERNKISIHKNTPLKYCNFINQYGEITKNFIINAGFSIDTRNNLLIPTKGFYQQVMADISMLDLKYYKISANFQYYLTFLKNYTFAINAIADYGASYSKKDFPIIKNIYLGGIGTIRGFEGSSIGPKDAKTGNYLGGSRRIVTNIQFYIPTLNFPDSNKFRLFLFSDAGCIYSQNDSCNLSSFEKNHNFYDWRFSAGIGFSWKSPIGPMQFSYGYPLNKRNDDKIQNFQFQIGTGF